MRFEFIYEPVTLIIIRDLFTKKENKEILAEAIKNKNKFKHAVIGSGKKPAFRSNKTAYYDDIYTNDRTKSNLLTKLDELFADIKFQEMLASAQYPIYLFSQSNYHESQVSRYGDGGQHYKYHIDAFNDNQRQVTVVYYFHEEPKRYKGGEIQFTQSPIYKGEPIDKNVEPITIVPENNMMVIFGSHIPHMVLPTTSPKTFSKGRFSVNCWVGRR